MTIQIADCSLRDGGYVGNKNFPEEVIKGIINGLVETGIDYIETGFLQTNVTGETLVYGNSKDIRKYLPSENKQSEFVGFCDNSRYCIDKLDDYDGKSFKVLKISFAKHEWREALVFASKAKGKGYDVFFQPMDAIGYTMEEREEMLEEVNKFKPAAFAIVDTFGAMHLDDLETIFGQIDKILYEGAKIALHTHNNLCIANALAEHLINLCAKADRNVVVDGSLLGMARGAGNSCTEEIASYINSRFGIKYNITALIETIEKYIVPVREKTGWGYDLPMFICGMEDAHVDNIGYLSKNTDCDYKDMYKVIHSMTPDQRKRYGKGYSKTDFTILQNTYSDLLTKGELKR